MPSTAAPRINHTELTLYRTSKTALTTASPTVTASTRAARPNCQVTASISASAATLTPSRNAPGEQRAPQTREQRPAHGHKHERREKDAERSHQGRPRYDEHVADE